MGDAYGDVEGSIIPIWSMFSNSLSIVSCMACGSGYGLLCTGSSVVNVMEYLVDDCIERRRQVEANQDSDLLVVVQACNSRMLFLCKRLCFGRS